MKGKNCSQVCDEDFVSVGPSVVLILLSPKALLTPLILPCHDAFLSINELDVKTKKLVLLVCAFNSALKFRVCPGEAQP